MIEGFFNGLVLKDGINSTEDSMDKVVEDNSGKLFTVGAYFVIETDLILIDCRKNMLPNLLKANLLDGISHVDIFITGIYDELIEGAAEVIDFFYHSIFVHQTYNICVYYPDMSVQTELQSYKINSNWYCLYTNMWDILTYEGENYIKYTFLRNKEPESYGLEFKCRNGVSYLYSGWSKFLSTKLYEGNAYDFVYQTIAFDHNDKHNMTYEEFLMEYHNARIGLDNQQVIFIGESVNPRDGEIVDLEFTLLAK